MWHQMNTLKIERNKEQDHGLSVIQTQHDYLVFEITC